MGNRIFLLKVSVSFSFAERFELAGFFFAPEFGKWVPARSENRPLNQPLASPQKNGVFLPSEPLKEGCRRRSLNRKRFENEIPTGAVHYQAIGGDHLFSLRLN